MNTVMITGCSSGFGLETARHFLGRGWNVVATMRNPDPAVLPATDGLRLLRLDVTDSDSIDNAVANAGEIDVLVNNAGIGWMNALEGTPLATIREIFETNTFGVMAMMQAVLPQFRAKKSGVIVNVSSSVTLRPLPLLSIYTASKAAINAFTESVAIELAAFDIRACTVVPGRAMTTRFSQTAQARMKDEGGFPEPYADFAESILARMRAAPEGPATEPQDVAEAIWRAATDPDCPSPLPAGADAIAWANDD